MIPPGVWVPWVLAAVVIVMIASLLGQAAFIRTRLDAMAPATPTSEAVRCSACNPAVRAYSLKVNVAATHHLSSLSATDVIAMRQLGVCSAKPTAPIQIEQGVFSAYWLVVRGGSGGASLMYDIASGYTRYLVISSDTYVITASPGSNGENAARDLVRSSADTGDLFFLIQSVAGFVNTFRSDMNGCRPIPVRSPFTSTSTSTSTPYLPILTTVSNASGSRTSNVLVHAWGYSGAYSSDGASPMYVE